MTSDELTALALRARGDKVALREVIIYEIGYVKGWVQSRIGETYPNDIDDIAQDILFAIARGIGKFKGKSAFATWCIRIMHNRLCEWLIKQNCPKRSMEVLYWDMRQVSGTCPPDSHLESEEVVNELIGMAAEVNRRCLWLMFAEDYQICEIAELYGIPYSRVRSRIRHGLAQIRTELEMNYEEAIDGIDS